MIFFSLQIFIADNNKLNYIYMQSSNDKILSLIIRKA